MKDETRFNKCGITNIRNEHFWPCETLHAIRDGRVKWCIITFHQRSARALDQLFWKQTELLELMKI